MSIPNALPGRSGSAYEAQYPIVGAGFKPASTDGETEIVACRARKYQSSVTPTDLTSALQRAISEVSSVASSSGDEPPAA